MSPLKRLTQLGRLYGQQATVCLELYSQPITAKHSQAGAVDEAIRWIDQVDIQGEVKPALFMHPTSSASFKIAVQPKMKFVTSVALLPQVWEQNEDGVEFVVRVEAAGLPPLEKKIFIHPRIKKNHRGWNLLNIELGAFAGKTVLLSLSTQVLAGASANHAWAVWGAPQVIIQKRLQGLRGMISNGVDRDTETPYLTWQKTHVWSPQKIPFTYEPTISLITPVYNVDPQWLDLCIESVRAQYYKKWELCLCDDGSTNAATVAALKKYVNTDPRIKIKFSTHNTGISSASNQAVDLATGEFIGLLDNDDELAPEALYEVVRFLQQHPAADMIYSDEDKLEQDGSRSDPFFKPDWSPEYFFSCMYTSHLTVYRRSVVGEVGGFRSAYDKSQDYDLALRIIEKTKSIFHIPQILYHWRKIATSTAASPTAKNMNDSPAVRAVEDYVKRNHLSARVEVDPVTTYHRIRYVAQGKVSILLHTKGDLNVLKICLTNIFEKTTYKNFEVILGHDENFSAESVEWLQHQSSAHPITVLQYQEPGQFNFAKKMNVLAKQATGEHLLFLHDDTEVISPEWMTSLLEFSQLPLIGMVGAKMYYPDGRIEHAGVVMGIQGGAGYVCRGKPRNFDGYFASTKVIRNFSAVSGACAMIKKKLFEELAGFDEQFVSEYADIDLCLRLLSKGMRNVFTPYAEVFHSGLDAAENRTQEISPEDKLLRSRWTAIMAHDSYYTSIDKISFF